MSPRKAVTIRDVAQEAGVSPGTVSRAMRGSTLVNEETRQRIMAVVDDLNYTPNLAARRLSMGKTLVILVIVPFFTRPSVAARLNGVVSVLAESEYDLLIHNISTPEQRANCFKRIPHPNEVDGVLAISTVPTDEEAARLAEAELPIVFIDADHPALTMHHRVTVNDIEGGQVATDHLLALGHRRIGFIGDAIDNPFNFISSRNRYWGYCKALNAAGIPVRPAYYAEGEHNRIAACGLTETLLSLPEPPSAIVAASDTQAVGVLETARKAGLRVPEDLSVIGYDDIEIAEVMQLTTMRQLLFESGRQGVELLLDTLENPQIEAVHRILPTELVVRASTAPPA